MKLFSRSTRRKSSSQGTVAAEVLEQRALLTGLDYSFGTNGFAEFAVNDLGNGSGAQSGQIAVSPDGAISVVGADSDTFSDGGDWYAARLTSDGQLDAAFGAGGRTLFGLAGTHNEPATPHDVLATADGGTITVGYGSKASIGATFSVIAKLDATGTPDPSFGVGGYVTPPYALPDFALTFAAALDANENILVATSNASGVNQVLRYQPDGTLDTSFVSDQISHAVTEMVIADDGSMYLSAVEPIVGVFNEFELKITRVDSSGAIDTAFGTSGTVTFDGGDFGYDTLFDTFEVASGAGDLLAVTPGGNLVGIANGYNFGLPEGPQFSGHAFRLNADGSLDSSFDGDGLLAIEWSIMTDINVDDLGALVLAGGYEGPEGQGSIIARIFADGSPDAAFPDDGVTSSIAPGIMILPTEFPVLDLEAAGSGEYVGTGDVNGDVSLFVTRVITQNNTAPTIEDATFALDENSADGTFVGVVVGADADVGDQLSYALTGTTAFAIDSVTGEITVADSAQLDFETTPDFTFTVSATDLRGASDTANVVVELSDVSEGGSVFTEIDQVINQLDDLVESGGLSQRGARRISRRLNQAKAALSRGNSDRAIRRLRSAQADVVRFFYRGDINLSDALPLFFGLEDIIAQINSQV